MTDRIDQNREVGWVAREENAVLERFLKPKVTDEIIENPNIYKLPTTLRSGF